LEKKPEELPGTENNNEYEKPIKNVPDTKGYPAKQEPLHFGNNRIYPQTIISFNPIRIPGCPFYKDGQYYKEYPTPAFHETVK